MKHQVVRTRKKKLGRDPSHRKALYRNLLTSLVQHGSIQTTLAKAKLVRPQAERLVTATTQAQPLIARRKALKVLYGKEAVNKLISEVAPRFKKRPGGYTRIVKLGARVGDQAQMARLEWVEEGNSKVKTQIAKPQRKT